MPSSSAAHPVRRKGRSTPATSRTTFPIGAHQSRCSLYEMCTSLGRPCSQLAPFQASSLRKSHPLIKHPRQFSISVCSAEHRSTRRRKTVTSTAVLSLALPVPPHHGLTPSFCLHGRTSTNTRSRRRAHSLFPSPYHVPCPSQEQLTCPSML